MVVLLATCGFDVFVVDIPKHIVVYVSGPAHAQRENPFRRRILALDLISVGDYFTGVFGASSAPDSLKFHTV